MIILIVILCALFALFISMIMYHSLEFFNDVFGDSSEDKHNIQQ